MHYQFVLISTLTTIAFAAPAPPNFRSTHTTTTTTTTTATLNKPTTHIGTPQFAHVPITIPDQRPPHPNLHPVYTPIARPGPAVEPGRNPLFSRSQREDKVKRDDPRAPAIAAVLSGIAEGIQKQQQQHQHARRAENFVEHVPDSINPAYNQKSRLFDLTQIIGRRAVDNEIYDSEDALDALDYPLQRKEQRDMYDGYMAAQFAALDTEGKRGVYARALPLQQRGLVQRDDIDDDEDDDEEEEYGIADAMADVQRRSYVRRDDGDGDEEVRVVDFIEEAVQKEAIQNAQEAASARVQR